MKDNKVCDERHEHYTTRMKSQAEDINKLFDTKAAKSILFWTLTIFFVLILGSFKYTKTVADDVSGVVTKQDMIKYQMEIIEAIEEITP